MDHPDPTAPAADAPPPEPSGLLAEFGQLGRGLLALLTAQLDLVSAELGLARAAVGRMLMAGVAAGVFALYLGMTLLALLAVLLAGWLGWAWALGVLVVLQAVLTGGALLAMGRCKRYIGFPATRAQWTAIKRETRARADQRSPVEDPA